MAVVNLSERDDIILTGVSTHNLKEVDVVFPRGQLTAVTGLSGSGKSSLVFDTLYAESRLRFLESLSPYLRQFMERWRRPGLRSAAGLLPAVAIQQKKPGRSARSTVGTITEIVDYLRLLLLTAGERRCPRCDALVRAYTAEDVARWCLRNIPGRNLYILLPIPLPASGGKHGSPGDFLARMGYVRVLAGDELKRIDEISAWTRQADVILDRIDVGGDEAERFLVSIRQALTAGTDCRVLLTGPGCPAACREDNVGVEQRGNYQLLDFPGRLRCVSCDLDLPALTESLLSFNSPEGACAGCKGFGETLFYDPARYLDPSRSLRENPVIPWHGPAYRRHHRQLLGWAGKNGWPEDIPFASLPAHIQESILHGQGSYPGVAGFFRQLEKKKYRLPVRVFISRFRGRATCSACAGKRLNPQALAVRLRGENLGGILAMTVEEALVFVRTLPLDDRLLPSLQQVLAELTGRLECLLRLGVGYLQLDRSSATLSSGEAQRIHLAAVAGARLADTLFILDEPTSGLHARDGARLAEILRDLTRADNTVIFVEHDPGFILTADHILELGPGAGQAGGRILFQGALPLFLRDAHSPTADFLRGEGRNRIRPGPAAAIRFLEIRGARARNLKSLTVRFALGALNCLTGVSGSGKSSLLEEALLPALQAKLARSLVPPEAGELCGWEDLTFVRWVDQGFPAGLANSTPVTYLGLMTPIRALFSSQEKARVRGVPAGHFSLNVPGGRCEACKGKGHQVLEMQFLADERILCEECGGTGYGRKILDYTCRGLSIVDALDLTVEQGLDFFETERGLRAGLTMLRQVGLGYLRLGQPLDSLSGGESQRLKLCRSLLIRKSGAGLFMLDEPTTGLHPADTARLLDVLDMLLKQGHTIIAIEHDLFFLANSDWVADLGPEGGDSGGMLVYQGEVAGLRDCPLSHTGRAFSQWQRFVSSE